MGILQPQAPRGKPEASGRLFSAAEQLPDGADRADSPRLAVAFTLIDATTRATKALTLQPDGIIRKESAVNPYAGTVRRVELAGTPSEIMHQFGDVLTGLESKQVIMCAPPAAARDEYRLTTTSAWAETPGTIARTKANFPPAAGPALMMLDIDAGEWPDALCERIKASPNISGALASVYEPFASAASLHRGSVSSGVMKMGGKSPAPTGEHRYYIASSGTDIERFVNVLAKRLMLAGFLWIKIADTGAMHERTLFDVAASSDPSRLAFEADAVLGAGLVYTRGARMPRYAPPDDAGTILDIGQMADLSPSEESRLAGLVADAKAACADVAAARRATWTEKRVADLVAKGTTPEAAKRIATGAVERHKLAGDFDIRLDGDGGDDGRAVTVAEILADPDRYHRQTGADPLEPDYRGGRNIAFILVKGGRVFVHSQAHGGVRYELGTLESHWFEALAEESESAALTGGTEAAAVPPSPADAAGWPEPLAGR